MDIEFEDKVGKCYFLKIKLKRINRMNDISYLW